MYFIVGDYDILKYCYVVWEWLDIKVMDVSWIVVVYEFWWNGEDDFDFDVFEIKYKLMFFECCGFMFEVFVGDGSFC